MSKKKPELEPIPAPEPEPTPEPEPAPEESPIYTKGRWQDFTTYNCRFCPFDTLDESVAIKHYEERHAPPPEPPPPPPSILISDRFGNPVS